MYTTILSDFSRVLLKPRNTNYHEGLNALHKKLLVEKGEQYNILEHFELNFELLNFFKSLKSNYSLNLFTTDIIQNDPKIRTELDKIFENIFAANDYGLSKVEPGAYSFIAGKIGIEPGSIIYVDDQEANVSAAAKAGLKALHYRNNNQDLIQEIHSLLAK